MLPISHRVALGLSEPKGRRAPKGLGGITRHGARTVRNAAFLLEQKYGGSRLTFLTCTIPPLTETNEYMVAREWAEIVRIFNQSLGRLLKAAGLPPSFVGCTEIQEKRQKERGGMPLHLHIVLPGRKPGKTWAISSDQFRALWRRAIVARVPQYSEVSFSASVDTQKVKQSAEGYLGKYMTKGSGQIQAILERDPGMQEFIPSSWWNCSLNLRRAIGNRITGGRKTARELHKDICGGDSRVEYSRRVLVDVGGGVQHPVAIIGRLSPEGRKRYTHWPGRLVPFDKIGNEAVT